MIKCRICDAILEEIESINDDLVYIEPCPSCVNDAVLEALQSVQRTRLLKEE